MPWHRSCNYVISKVHSNPSTLYDCKSRASRWEQSHTWGTDALLSPCVGRGSRQRHGTGTAPARANKAKLCACVITDFIIPALHPPVPPPQALPALTSPARRRGARRGPAISTPWRGGGAGAAPRRFSTERGPCPGRRRWPTGSSCRHDGGGKSEGESVGGEGGRRAAAAREGGRGVKIK